MKYSLYPDLTFQIFIGKATIKSAGHRLPIKTIELLTISNHNIIMDKSTDMVNTLTLFLSHPESMSYVMYLKKVASGAGRHYKIADTCFRLMSVCINNSFPLWLAIGQLLVETCLGFQWISE